MDAIYYQPPQKFKIFRRLKKILFWTLIAIFMAGFFYAVFFIYEFYSTGKKISAKNNAPALSFIQTIKNIAGSESISLRSSSENRINILLLGVAGKGKPGGNLTDTIMIASLNPKSGRVAFLSLPRDLYVKIPEADYYSKINSIYQLGIDNSKNNSSAGKNMDIIKKTIQNITALPIDYCAVVNFDGFEKIIDGIGGINIENERDIFDPRYPGPNYSYETFELKKGFHHLDGATALKYARERHNDPQGDFGRAKRQQQVLQAVKNKIFSAGTFLNVFALNDIFNALGDNVTTDIKPQELGGFLELSKKLDTQNIINVVADAWNKDSLLKVSHIFSGSTRTFILVPRIGNWSELQDMAENIFELDKIKKRQNEIAKEQASVLILNRSGDRTLTDKITLLLKNKIEIQTVNILTEKEKNISPKTIIIDNTQLEKIFTLDELIKKLGAGLDETGLSVVRLEQKPDFIIILGQDLIEAHNFEEDSIEEYNAEF